MRTKFEEIVDNTRIFKIILDEFFHDWPGSYDVMPAEDPQVRLFENHRKFADFCAKIRSNSDGYKRCMECDLRYAEDAKEKKEPLYYTCHAGLMDIAVPIIVDEELIATIFCGQSRSRDEGQEYNAIQKTTALEKDLGFQDNELVKLREKTPLLSNEQIQDVKSRLWEVATYVSTLGSRKIEAEKAKNEIAFRLRESKSIQEILRNLLEIVDTLDEFWKKIDTSLENICETIGATYSLFISCEKTKGREYLKGNVKSLSNLPITFHDKHYNVCDGIVSKVIKSFEPKILSFGENPEPGTICSDVLSIAKKDHVVIDKVALIPVRLRPGEQGIILFFLSNEKEKTTGLSVEQELDLLVQAGAQITIAHQNCLLYIERKWYADAQSEWLENVSHQIVAPINEILGQTENLSRSFKKWKDSEPERVESTLENLKELSNWAARLAINFAWIAKGTSFVRELNLQAEGELPGRLIGYARNVQGMAKSRGIKRVHVDIDSVKQLNWRILIDRIYFKQAITNILDNAIKYSYPDTQISIRATLSRELGHIYIINYGIPIHENKIEKIFERGYRTDEAIETYAVGTGIGLTISREILRLHGGDISVTPSTQSALGWKTIFEITLPLI